MAQTCRTLIGLFVVATLPSLGWRKQYSDQLKIMLLRRGRRRDVGVLSLRVDVTVMGNSGGTCTCIQRLCARRSASCKSSRSPRDVTTTSASSFERDKDADLGNGRIRRGCCFASSKTVGRSGQRW